MTTATLAPPILHTAQDLERLSAEGYHYALVRGELREMTPPGGMHGSTTSRLTIYVGQIVIDQDLGETFAAETGFLVGRNPDTVLAPDFAFIAKDRLPDSVPRSYVPVVPDIVLETRSPNDTRREVAEKVEQWLDLGVRLVWELNPATRLLTVHCAGVAARELGVADILGGGDVLPDLRVPVAKLFSR